jgi:hypothetical protein
LWAFAIAIVCCTESLCTLALLLIFAVSWLAQFLSVYCRVLFFSKGIAFNRMALNVDMHGRQMQVEVSLQVVKTHFATKAGGLIGFSLSQRKTSVIDPLSSILTTETLVLHAGQTCFRF